MNRDSAAKRAFYYWLIVACYSASFSICHCRNIFSTLSAAAPSTMSTGLSPKNTNQSSATVNATAAATVIAVANGTIERRTNNDVGKSLMTNKFAAAPNPLLAGIYYKPKEIDETNDEEDDYDELSGGGEDRDLSTNEGFLNLFKFIDRNEDQQLTMKEIYEFLDD